MKRLVAVLAVITPAAVFAQVVPIGPFSGTLHEGYETFSTGFTSSLAVFGGAGTLTASPAGNNLNVTSGWSFFSFIAPHSGNQFMGATTNYLFTFNTPASQFGAFWGTNADSPGATATFFNSAGGQIGSTLPVTAPQGTWAWGGWQFAPGFSSVLITANNQFGGFIMNDDAELIPAVPEPASMLVLGLGLTALIRRRRQAK